MGADTERRRDPHHPHPAAPRRRTEHPAPQTRPAGPTTPTAPAAPTRGSGEFPPRLLALPPRLHCFGHIHASAGITCLNGTTYVNASMVNRRYENAHQPIEPNARANSPRPPAT